MNRFLLVILTLASIVATKTAATHIPIEEDSRFSDDNSQFEERRNYRASNAHQRGKNTSSPTKRATKRLPLATRKPTPAPTPSQTRKATKRLPLATRKPTPAPTLSPTRKATKTLPLATRKPTPAPSPSPTRKATKTLPLATRKPTPAPTPSPTRKATKTLAVASRKPTPSPTRPPTDCLAVDKAVYECGDPITVSFDVAKRKNPEPARIRDFIGIFPHYVSSYDVPEVWQWTCGPPPFAPNTCLNGPQYSGNVVFHGLPKYNLEPSAWPVSANYDSLEREVNRFFKVVLLRGDGTTYCVSRRFEILENSLSGCSIRMSSPSG